MRHLINERNQLWLAFFGELSAYFLFLLVMLLLAIVMEVAIKGINYLSGLNHDAMTKVAPVLFGAPLVICAIVTFSMGVAISTRRLCRGLGKNMAR
jgi:hypothetical protein